MLSPRLAMAGLRGTLLVALAACLLIAARAFKYAVVLDCGSRGTRLHVFRRKPDGGVEDMLPQSLKIVPGLSTFADRPHGAVEYLLPLLKFAGSVVPAEAHSHDPHSAANGLGGDASLFTEVFLMGTGGMRQLRQVEEDALLDAAVNGLNERRSAGPHDSGHGQPFLLKRHQAVTLSGAAEVSAPAAREKTHTRPWVGFARLRVPKARTVYNLCARPACASYALHCVCSLRPTTRRSR